MRRYYIQCTERDTGSRLYKYIRWGGPHSSHINPQKVSVKHPTVMIIQAAVALHEHPTPRFNHMKTGGSKADELAPYSWPKMINQRYSTKVLSPT